MDVDAGCLAAVDAGFAAAGLRDDVDDWPVSCGFMGAAAGDGFGVDFGAAAGILVGVLEAGGFAGTGVVGAGCLGVAGVAGSMTIEASKG